jgi:hypothetical protein
LEGRSTFWPSPFPPFFCAFPPTCLSLSLHARRPLLQVVPAEFSNVIMTITGNVFVKMDGL